MEGIDYTALLNAVIGLVTAAVIWISVRIGRRVETEKQETPAKNGIGITMQGAAIISGEPLLILARAVEAGNFTAIESNKLDKDRTAALRGLATAARKYVESTDKLRDEIEELRNEIARRR